MAIIIDEFETYVQFLYPINGLNWVQGDVGESGLPDVRAQAGFVSSKITISQFLRISKIINKFRCPKMGDSTR